MKSAERGVESWSDHSSACAGPIESHAVRPSLLAGGFFALTQLFPRLRPALWQRWYNLLAHRDGGGELLFMNYGYEPDAAASIGLMPEDEPFRYGIQLYAHVLQGIEVTGKDVLEVGCGRGGGGNFLVRYGAPRSYTGIDLSNEAIAWCQRRLNFPEAKWVHGRADDLPVGASSVDVVVNVESSHSYPSMPAFLEEVRRVLRPGGYFAFADVRTTGQLPELDRQIARSGLNRVDFHTITPQVLRALDVVTGQREAQIAAHVPRLLRAAFRDFAGVQNSVLYSLMAQGGLQYVCYSLQKACDSD